MSRILRILPPSSAKIGSDRERKLLMFLFLCSMLVPMHLLYLQSTRVTSRQITSQSLSSWHGTYLHNRRPNFMSILWAFLSIFSKLGTPSGQNWPKFWRLGQHPDKSGPKQSLCVRTFWVGLWPFLHRDNPGSCLSGSKPAEPCGGHSVIGWYYGWDVRCPVWFFDILIQMRLINFVA